MPRILFVVPLHSPHSARWVSQLAGSDWDIHVFGSGTVLSSLFHGQAITLHTVWPIKSASSLRTSVHRDLWPFYLRGRGKMKALFPSIARTLMKEWSQQLSEVIEDLQPDIVHSLKMVSTKLVYDALQHLPSSKHPTWAYSIWGKGDILAEDQPFERTRALLQSVNYLMADNPRDLMIARERGFHGEDLGVFPTGGGYPIETMRATLSEPPSKRRIIALKGYQAAESGQALRALDALQLCKTQLTDYKIVIHSAKATHAYENYEDVKSKAEIVSQSCGIPVEFLPYSPIEAIWDLFCKSRISLAISTSDGTPNTLLEALAVGAFPIQSNTGGLEHWVDSGQNGILVPWNDTAAIADAITRSINDDDLVDRAAGMNYELTDEKLDRGVISSKVLSIYDRIARKEHAKR